MSQKSDNLSLNPHSTAIPCSKYSYEQLAEIYNQGRVDYIVPMPMNAKRMLEYVNAYDIDMNLSLIAVDLEDKLPNGICMTGIRQDRGWITRLGVIPERRRRKTGEFLMREIMNLTKSRGISQLQLEVIRGNEPARQLFEKLGFEPIRDLVVLRRPPSKLPLELIPTVDISYEIIEDTKKIIKYLEERDDVPSWIEETSSLVNSGNMRLIHAQHPNGEVGWIAFQRTPFQLTHFVFSPHASNIFLKTLLAIVHHIYPLQDTKIENIPLNHPAYDSFQTLGYIEAFQRIEMVLSL